MAQAGSLFFRLIPQLDQSAMAAEAKKAGQVAGASLGQSMGSTAGTRASTALGASSRSMEAVAAQMGTRVSTAISKPLGTAFNPLGAASDWALRQINRIPPGVGAAMGTVYGHAVNAGNGIVEVFTRSTAQATQTISTWGQRLKSVMAVPIGLASNMFAQLGAAVGGAALVAAGVQRISQIEQARAALVTMMGDAQRANTLLDQVLAFAKTTPFAFPDLATAARNMIAFGMNAADVIPTLRAVGDAAAASGQGAQGLTQIVDVFGAIQVAGKLSMEEINRLATGGVPALQILANQAGVSIDEMRKRISAGTVSAKDAIAGLVKGMEEGTKGLAGETPKFAGLMDKLKGTWIGAVDSFKSAITSTMATIMEPILPRVEQAMGWIGTQFKRLPEALGYVKTAIQPILDFITGPLLTAGRNLWDAFEPITQLIGVALVGAWRLLGGVLDWLGPLLVSITQWLKDHQIVVVAIVGFIGGYAAATTALAAAMGVAKIATAAWAVVQAILNGTLFAGMSTVGLWVAVLAALVAAIIYAYNHSETFRNIVQAAWNGIKSAAETAWNFLKGVFEALSTAVSAVGDWFSRMGDSAGGAWNSITSAVSTGWQWLVANVWTPMVTFFTQTIPAAWEGLKNTVASVWNGIVEVVKFAVTLILTVILAPLLWFVESVFPGGLNGLLAIWTAIWDGIKAVGSAVWSFIRDSIFQPIVTFVTVTLPGGFNWLRDQAVAAWNAIRDGVNAAWQWILNNIWNPIIAYINGTLSPRFNWLRDQVIAAWNNLRDGINAAWQWILNNIWNPIINFINSQLVPRFEYLKAAVLYAWEQMKNGIQAGWDWIRDRIWNPIVTFITETIPGAFQRGVEAVGRLWDGIKRALRDPVQAAINVVYNEGIVKVWNWVAEKVNLGTRLDRYDLPNYATGGPVTGGVPGKDSVLLAAMPGEYVLSKATVEGLGGLGIVDWINNLFRGGGRTAATALSRLFPGFQAGGSVAGASASGSATIGAATGSVQAASALELLGDWLGDLTGGLSKLPGLVSGAGEWGQLVLGFGRKIGTSVVDFLKAKVAAFLAAVAATVGGGGTAVTGGGPVRDIVQRTAAQFGWGSGAQWNALAWIIAHESGWNPNAQNPTSTAYGLFQFLNSTWGTTGIGKTSDPALQALAGMRYIQRRYGSPLGAQAFWQSHGWYDEGGLLPTGWSMAYNGTGRPEAVLTADQLTRIVGGTRGGDQPLIGVLNLTVPQGASTQEVVDELSFALRHSRRGLHARARR